MSRLVEAVRALVGSGEHREAMGQHTRRLDALRDALVEHDASEAVPCRPEAQKNPTLAQATKPARLDVDGTAKPLTEIAAVVRPEVIEQGQCLLHDHQIASYVVRPSAGVMAMMGPKDALNATGQGAEQRRSEATPEPAKDVWAVDHLECAGCGCWCPGTEMPAAWTKTSGVYYCFECSHKRQLEAERRSDAQPEIEVVDMAGGGDGPWRLLVNGYGVASWPSKSGREEPREYAEEVARVLRLALGQRSAAASPSEPVLCDACGKDLDAESTAAAENARCHRTLGCSRERDHGGDCTPMANQPGDPTIRHVVAWMRQTYPQNQHAREWANEIERVFLRGAAATPVEGAACRMCALGISKYDEIHEVGCSEYDPSVYRTGFNK